MLPQSGLQLVQQTPGDQIMSVDEEPKEETRRDLEFDSWQNYFSEQFSNLFKLVGKIKNYKVQAEFLENLTPIQKKGRRVPITMQDNVDTEIDKLLKQGHIEKFEECSDKYFVSTIVITKKKDGSVKLALESGELNKQVHKNKDQMPRVNGHRRANNQREENVGYVCFDNGFNIRILSITFKRRNKRTMQFFSYWRSVNGNL